MLLIWELWPSRGTWSFPSASWRSHEALGDFRLTRDALTRYLEISDWPVTLSWGTWRFPIDPWRSHEVLGDFRLTRDALMGYLEISDWLMRLQQGQGSITLLRWQVFGAGRVMRVDYLASTRWLSLKQTEKHVPSPFWLFTSICRLFISQYFFTRASPRPLPS